VSAEAVVYALLSGAGPVTAIVGTRIYPVVLPRKQKTTAIVYELVSAVRHPAIDATNSTHLVQSRVTVNLLGTDYEQVRVLREAVVSALQFQRGTIGGVTVHAVLHSVESAVTFDSDLGLYMRPIDFIVHHQQT
jgi:hypothetical protein